jgi:hypothetical protein
LGSSQSKNINKKLLRYQILRDNKNNEESPAIINEIQIKQKKLKQLYQKALYISATSHTRIMGIIH